MSYSALYSRVSTSNPSSTRILEVTVTGDDPAMTKAIVDKICDIGPAKIQEAMGISQVNLYEYGTDPVLSRDSYNLLIYGVIGAAASLLVFGIFLLAFILDDRIRSDEDVERYLGLSILAEIPDLNDSSKDRYGYYRGYGQGGKTRTKRHKAPKKED
jgi:capsular polysaccharide biosynthesis protein